MAEGTIKSLLERFGFIKARDGTDDVHFRRDQAPRDCREGDHVEYDPEDGPKGPRVRGNIRITQRSQRQGGQDKQGGDRDRQQLAVVWTFDEPELRTYGEGDLAIKMLEVPLVITVKTGTKPKLGVTLTLKANGQSVRDPDEQITTDNDGQATFVLGLEETATRADLVLIVREGEKTTTFSKRWQRQVEEKKPRHIKAQKIGSDGTWTTIRVLTLTSDKADAERLEADTLAECGSEIEVEGVTSTGHSVEVKIDSGSKVIRVKLAKAGKAEVSFRSKDDPRVESNPIEIETKPVPTCKRITAEVEMSQPGYRNILKIRTQVGEDPASDGIATGITVENLGSGELEIGTDQGRTISFTTDAKGKATRTVFFVAPEWCGDVVVYATADPNVRTEKPVYLRHPENAVRP